MEILGGAQSCWTCDVKIMCACSLYIREQLQVELVKCIEKKRSNLVEE